MIIFAFMKEFILTEAQSEKAVLVGLVTPEQNEQRVKEYLTNWHSWPTRQVLNRKTVSTEIRLSQSCHVCR
jgi:hypothetical protein